MRNPDLQELERDIEATRARLAHDLETLKRPSTISQFTSALKSEAVIAKDAAMESVQTGVQSALQGAIEDLKGRAAANPAAALAIGAGIAWRLFQRPPIATALVGAGLMSLLRTPPLRTDGESLVSHARQRFAEQVGTAASTLRDGAMSGAEVAQEKFGDLATVVKDQTRAFTSEAAEIVGDISRKVGDGSSQLREVATSVGGKAPEHLTEIQRPLRAVSDEVGRDGILLGIAGVAVAAALTIAYQRRGDLDR